MKRDRSAQLLRLSEEYREMNYEAARRIAKDLAHDPRYDGLPRVWAGRVLALGVPPKRGQQMMFAEEE